MTTGTILGRPLGQAVALATSIWGVIALVCEQVGLPIPGPIVAGVTAAFGAILAFIAGGEPARTAAAVDVASTTSSATVTVTAPTGSAPTPLIPPTPPTPPIAATPPKP